MSQMESCHDAPIVLADAVKQTQGVVGDQVGLDILVGLCDFLNPTLDLNRKEVSNSDRKHQMTRTIS